MPQGVVVLLGPQRVEVDVGRVLRDLGVSGPVALITAGWQERESEDADLVARLGVPAVNLGLHRRSEDVFARDPEFTTAYKARQTLLRHLQDFYKIRLDYTDEAARAIAVRHVESELLEGEWKISVDELRGLDKDHLERCRAIHVEFDEKWRTSERPAVARHRQELRQLIEPTTALIIAGGHVASLYNRMELFDVIGLTVGRPVIGWSAGAMVLTDKIVLFHDYPPYGKDIAQVLDAGFGLVDDVVVLPDPRRRIRFDERDGIARFAQRMAPAKCLAMDHGAHLHFEDGKLVRAYADLLSDSGEVLRSWAG